MTVIKFSHIYNKMPRDFQQSKLLEVISIKLEEMSEEFREYDTSFLDWSLNTKGGLCHYPLPAKGEYMILFLQAGSGCGQLWTTIRSRWGGKGNDKYIYYKTKIGEIVECQIQSTEEK
jgi:hypothetical protein